MKGFHCVGFAGIVQLVRGASESIGSFGQTAGGLSECLHNRGQTLRSTDSGSRSGKSARNPGMFPVGLFFEHSRTELVRSVRFRPERVVWRSTIALQFLSDIFRPPFLEWHGRQ